MFGTCASGGRSFHIHFSVAQLTGDGSSDDGHSSMTDNRTGLAQGPWFFKIVKTPSDWSGGLPTFAPTTSDFSIEVHDQFSSLINQPWPCTTPTYPEPADWDGGCGWPYFAGGGSCWNGVYGPCPNPGFSTYTYTAVLSYVSSAGGLGGYYGFDVDVYGQMVPFPDAP